MTTRIMKHNPAFLSREELVRSFVARQDDLAFVLEHIADNTGASSKHLLMVAPRGMGKTTLALRAAEAVRTDARLSKTWYPLVYAEETYEVTAAGELWLEGLRHLGEQTKNAALLEAHRELRRERDEQRLYDRALGMLLDFADEQKKRLLLVVENLHMLLDEQISEADAWKLRKTLQTERRLLLLATATASFEAIENEQQAFFEQFRIYRLEPLDLESARQVWAHVAGAPISAERMRPLYILTGGNPRLLAILASFAGTMSLRALMGDLVRLVDDHTTYFKSNLDSLPAKERKVYVALADLWQPSTAREVADQARLSASEASALLNRLTQRGAVTAAGEERRKVYQLVERMYNIYHLLRRSGGDETRVRAVVDFMVGFYDPMSLGGVMRAIATEGAQLAEDDRRDHLLVMESLFRREASPRIRELWMKEIASLESWTDTPKSLRAEITSARVARLKATLSTAGLPFEAVMSLLDEHREVFRSLLSATPAAMARSASSSEDGSEARAAATGLVWTLGSAPERSISALRTALKGRLSTPRRALLLACLARCLKMHGDYEQAETSLRDAVALSPKEPGFLANLAWLLADQPGRAAEAEQHARRAIDLDESIELAWRALFGAFHAMSQEEADACADVYRRLLVEKDAPVRHRVAAGLWAFNYFAKSGDKQMLVASALALSESWGSGLRSATVNHVILRIALTSRHRQKLKALSGLVAWFSAVLSESDVGLAFDALWEADDPSAHALAAPYLPVVLADETLGYALLPIAGLLVVLGRWSDALPVLQRRIAHVSSSPEPRKPDEETLQLWTRIFIDAAVTGRAREALDLLTPSPLAAWLEPVVSALHMHLGDPHRAPLEVTEVARDVVERIRQRAAALKANAQPRSVEAAARPPVSRTTAARMRRSPKRRAPTNAATRNATTKRTRA